MSYLTRLIKTENRFSRMKRIQIWYLLFISGFSSFTLGSSDFHFVNSPMNYTMAKSFCRETYTDLATIRNSEEMNILTPLAPSGINRAWIGLEIGDIKMWHWSWPDYKLDYFNWEIGEPQNQDQDTCAAMNPSGKWFESDCTTAKSFVCHANGSASGPIFVAETRSWREAQDHCRTTSSDLVSIQSAEENEAVHNVTMSQDVWIGLFSDRWTWSDGSNSSFRYWKPNRPNNFETQHCVVTVLRDEGQWNNLRCSGNQRFFCQGAEKSILTSTTTQNTSTQPIPTTVQTVANQTTIPDNTSQAPTNQTTSVNVSTHQSTTNSSPTTVNTTDPVIPLNITTEVTNTTNTTMATHPPTNATVQVLGNSTYATTQPSTSVPTENSQGLTPEKVILIQENMTWIEAMSYCRMHHADLVYITTKEIQEMVAEKAKNATSSHVWLGLRYTCSLNFWFWTRLSTACYQNWAPGQGPGETYACGITGAIEATGRQQWVGLPETEKLNFLCHAMC